MENISAMANINHMGDESFIMAPPLYMEVGTSGFTSVRSVRSGRLSVPIISVSLSSASYRSGGQTRDVDPMLG